MPAMATPIKVTMPALYPKQRRAIFSPARYSVIEASTKAGKGQPAWETVWTPAGPKRMGEIKVGDTVLHPDGGTSVVEGVFPRGVQQTYRVTFADGAVVTCDGDHLWEVHRNADHAQKQYEQRRSISGRQKRSDYRGGVRVISTNEMLKWSERTMRRHWVPQHQATAFPARLVPVDPYALGILIAEGTLSAGSVVFSSGDAEIVDYMSSIFGDEYALRQTDPFTYHVTAGRHGMTMAREGTHIAADVRALGLDCTSDKKHIPKEYIINSEEVRWAVLQGIMDGDGFVNKHGQPVIEQTSGRLAKDIEQIIESLGGSVITNIREVNGYKNQDGKFVACKPVFRQTIRHAEACKFFRLSRKACATRPRSKPVRRTFRSIEAVGLEPTICIKVSSRDGLYLTSRFITTHNTLGCIVWQAYRVMNDTKAREHWWVAPVYPQSNIAYRRAKKMFQGLCKTNDTDMCLTFDNGARWVFKSGEKPDNLYGEDVADAVLDEFTRLREESWHAVRSTLTATRGPVRFIGNVKGRGNWGYKIARLAEDGSNERYEYHKIVAWDAVDAGVLDREEIEDAKASLPDNVFRELYLCEPSDDGGNPFSIDAIRDCKIKRQSSEKPVAYGIDLAKSYDYTWVYGIDESGREAHSERWQGSWGDTRKRILAIVGDTPTLIDSTGVGDPIVEELSAVRKNITGFKFTSQSKQQIMEGLAVAIQQGSAGIADDRAIAELEVFEYEYTRTGVRYTAPAGLHDDGVCAMALAHECKRSHRPATVYIGGSMLDDATTKADREWFGDADRDETW